jgi:hypothetical protein
MKSIALRPLMLLVLIWTFSSCAKDEISPWERYQADQVETQPVDYLTLEEDEFFASVNDVTGFNNSNIVLPNGYTIAEFLKITDSLNTQSVDRGDPYDNLGPLAAKNRLIAEITRLAQILVDKSHFQYEADGPNRPKQDGLVYSYGSRDYTKRYNPGKDHCLNEVYGLDCSGLMYVLFKNAGVDIGTNSVANEQRMPNFIQEKVTNAIPSLKKLKVEDLGTIPTNKFETGDIIYWKHQGQKSAFHIGTILKRADGSKAIFQSNGSPNQCSTNILPRRGPRTIELNQVISFFKTDDDTPTYGIVRMNTEISGKWEFHFRCEGNNYDFITHELNFPTTNQNSFKINKDFTDSDGSFNHTVFNFAYDNSTNDLSCDYITTDDWIIGFERKDHFVVRLDKDDTGYFVSQNDYINNGSGCTLEVALMNKE